MKKRISRIIRPLSLAAPLCLSLACHAAESPRSGETGEYRNLFKELLGKTDEEIDAKVDAAFQKLFHGDPDFERIYYPIDGDLAYLPDVGNRDVRSEGLSYGMMIAVQLDKKEEFDRIWKFAKTHMYHDEGPLRGYFTWHTAYDGSMTREDGSVIRGNGPAPDGEEWFVTALFFASHRWGDGEGIFDYSQEAQSLLHTMIHKEEEEDRGRTTAMFNHQTTQIVFTPDPNGSQFTDPSYHLPAFYELWAKWAEHEEDREFMAAAAKASRELFRKAAHSETGLMANYTGFDGRPHATRWMPGEFREDAWRTLSNPALDWAWWGKDPWQVEQSNRVLSFFSRFPIDDWPDHLELDGTIVRQGEKSPGLTAMAATAGLAADPELARPVVQKLWDMPVPDDRGRDNDGIREDGQLRSWRYYDGLLTMIGLLEASGKFRIHGPSSDDEESAIPLVYEVENSGADTPAPPLPDLDELPKVEPLTDPFQWSDGSGRSTKFSDWKRRRAEIKAEIEHYEIGPKPDRPEELSATYDDGKLSVEVTVNGETLTLTSQVVLPEGDGPFPAIIGIGRGTGSLPGDIFTERNIAQIGFNFGQVMSHTQKRGQEPINKLYPELEHIGAYSAWSWGVSRLIDGLEEVRDELPIDLGRLGITGCSFAGKMALFAGAFDERIALTIAQEPGGGGAAAWRVSETLGNVETLGRTSHAWFMETMFRFSGDNVARLPMDHHELVAMIAPRAALILGNPDYEWLADESGYVSCRAAHEVWKAFGVGERFGYSIVADHPHCVLPEVQKPEVEAFVDKFLLGRSGVKTEVATHPFDSTDAGKWFAWWGSSEPKFPDSE